MTVHPADPMGHEEKTKRRRQKESEMKKCWAQKKNLIKEIAPPHFLATCHHPPYHHLEPPQFPRKNKNQRKGKGRKKDLRHLLGRHIQLGLQLPLEEVAVCQLLVMDLNPLLVAIGMPVMLVARRERHLGIADGLRGRRLVVEWLVLVNLEKESLISDLVGG